MSKTVAEAAGLSAAKRRGRFLGAAEPASL
jgi:hypothetical protein